MSPGAPDGRQAIRFEDVSFSYGRKIVFERFSCVFPVGRNLLLGPNGAGKSTLLQLAVGLKRLDIGTLNPAPDASIGYMPQHIRPIGGLSVCEQIAYCGWLKGLGKREAKAEALVALERVDLAEVASTQSTRLSGGQIRRLGLAQSLIGSPGWLLLDEPTAGLDPDQRDRFARLIGDLDVPVIVATHQVEDIGSLFDHVVVLLPSRAPYSSPVADFLALDGGGRGDAVSAYRAACAIVESRQGNDI